MTRAALVYDELMAEYRFGPGHPLLPERFVLAVQLMDAWGLLGEGERRARVLCPDSASEADLLRIHSAEYVAVVKNEYSSVAVQESHGLGSGDTPRFPHMHQSAARIAGGTIRALDGVLAGEFDRGFNPAGGLHHAHRDRAAGFCVYNDCAVAMARAIALNPGLRLAYVDIDAHHGDGVQESFYDRDDVITISLHESGQFLYPGTGASNDIGEGRGRGYAINVPLPPYSGPDEYHLAFDRVVEPALRVFQPDVIVAQLGADAYRTDPLTHLNMTVAGHASLSKRLVAASGALCEGRIVATGGGGYEAFSATPRMWACALAALLEADPPAELPADWLVLSARSAAQHGVSLPAIAGVFDEADLPATPISTDETLRLAELAIEQTVASSPLLGDR